MIVKIWGIKGKGNQVKPLQQSLDYVDDEEKMTSSEMKQLRYLYDNDEEMQQIMTWDEFRVLNEDNINAVFNYAANEDKIEGLKSGYLCDVSCAIKEFFNTKEANLRAVGRTLDSDTGAQAFHIVQSFPEELDISDEEVHQCGMELLERLGLYQGVVFSHVHPVVDEEQEVHGKCKHNHIIINSHIYHEFIDPDNPRKMKYNDCKETYAYLQLLNDQIAIEHGLPIITEPDLNKVYSWKETDERNKGKSWKQRVRMDINNAMRIASDKEEFISQLKALGYQCREGNSRSNGAYITYTCPDNTHKVRDYVLGKDYTIEQLEAFWELKKNIEAESLTENNIGDGAKIQELINASGKNIFVKIRRETSQRRKEKMRSQGLEVKNYYNYYLNLTQNDFKNESVKSYFIGNEVYEIVDENHNKIANVTGYDLLEYYHIKQEIDKEKKREIEKNQNNWYSNKDYINSKTHLPYRVRIWDQYGRKRTTIELIAMLAIVVLKNEHPEENNRKAVIDEKRNDPIHAKRDWKVQNMLDTIKISREEKVEDYSDLKEKLEMSGKALSKAKAETRRITTSLNKMSALDETLQEFSTVQKICEDIFALPSGNEKNALLKKHELDIQKYKQCKAIMYQNKVVQNEQIQAFFSKKADLEAKKDYLEKKLPELKEEYRKLAKLNYNLQLAQNKLYCYGTEYEREREPEKTHSDDLS